MVFPLVKWAGGKRQILEELKNHVPKISGTYYEPFIGGGALFFALKTEARIGKSIVSDLNGDLLNLYKVTQKEPLSLWESLEDMKYGNTPDDYYSARREFNREKDSMMPHERAALFLYLNKHCYNGLFRVNSMGEFNVPFGKYVNPSIPKKENIMKVSKALEDTRIVQGDFDEILSEASLEDFAYLDPPYFPISTTSSFTDYQAAGFGIIEQKRLAKTFQELDKKGVNLMLSNSATSEILQLYEQFNVKIIEARRMINSNSNGRGTVKEVVITNYHASQNP